MTNQTISKCWSLAALLMFAAATFQIAVDRFPIGAVCFGSAACFLAAAGKYRKKEAEENRQGKEVHQGYEQ